MTTFTPDPSAFALVSAYESGHAAGRADLLRELGLSAQERSGIYVASRASIPERAAMWRALRSSGHPIISTWIDEDGPGQTADYAELWQRIANEIASARLLVLYAEPEDFPLKGALTEVGIAIGCGVPVRVVLPGATMEGRTFRPVGSWIKHPMVTICDTVEEAFSALPIATDFIPDAATIAWLGLDGVKDPVAFCRAIKKYCLTIRSIGPERNVMLQLIYMTYKLSGVADLTPEEAAAKLRELE